MEKIDENTYKLGEGKFLQKKGSEWRIIYPFKKDLNKPLTKDNIHWKNVLYGGSISNLIVVVIVVFLLLFLVWSYSYDMDAYERCVASNPLYMMRNLPRGEFNITEDDQPPNEYSLFIPSSYPSA